MDANGMYVNPKFSVPQSVLVASLLSLNLSKFKGQLAVSLRFEQVEAVINLTWHSLHALAWPIFDVQFPVFISHLSRAFLCACYCCCYFTKVHLSHLFSTFNSYQWKARIIITFHSQKSGKYLLLKQLKQSQWILNDVWCLAYPPWN